MLSYGATKKDKSGLSPIICLNESKQQKQVSAYAGFGRLRADSISRRYGKMLLSCGLGDTIISRKHIFPLCCFEVEKRAGPTSRHSTTNHRSRTFSDTYCSLLLFSPIVLWISISIWFVCSRGRMVVADSFIRIPKRNLESRQTP